MFIRYPAENTGNDWLPNSRKKRPDAQNHNINDLFNRIISQRTEKSKEGVTMAVMKLLFTAFQAANVTGFAN